ncbi:alpha/beta hydrolase [Mycobacterium sp. ITM-2016-00318]|uniref:alpha/beta hydrolase n=1 Tax=Mycobacterium sp. ITM-2016-00318 TaxID=2099693 RepID=UPI0013048688|nr:alpha/beta hydrolase [Mycobacterium sp. ITM-2016-00318]WNG92936.1 alpha/beta hydrolase [Mycobacterium sp. ITM-2016-00318]
MVVATGFGCGSAWAEPAGLTSSGAGPTASSDSQSANSSSGAPDRSDRREGKSTISQKRAPRATGEGANGEDAGLDHRSVERKRGGVGNSPSGRPSGDPVAESSARKSAPDASTASGERDPSGQGSLTTGQSQKATPHASIPPELASPYDERPEKLGREVVDAGMNFEHAGMKTAGTTDADQPAAALANTPSPSAVTGPDSQAVGLTITPKTASAVETLVDIAQHEGNASALVTAAANAVAGVDEVPSGVYTGQPSFIQQVVVFVLRVVNAVLSPVGGILAFTGLKVPIFADGVPPFFVTAGLNVEHDTIAGMPVYILTPPSPTGATVVALHGGAYAAEASLFHYEMYADLARQTGATVIVPDYPLIGEPGGTADVVVPQTAALISQVIATNGAKNTYVLGDSAGGGLALAAVQLLVVSGAATPRRMVLLAPWLDATVSDPASAAMLDPLLNVATLRRDGELWAGELGPAHPWASPINGSLDGLPPITVFSGSADLLSPQALRLRALAIAEGADITFVLRNGYMHDYPIFFFLPDALAERPLIYQALLGDSTTQAKDLSAIRAPS